MSENKQLLDQHQERVDSITDQHDAQRQSIDISNGSAAASVGKERIITSELEQPVEKHENLDSITGQGDLQSVAKFGRNGLAKAGCRSRWCLGTVAATLASRLKLRD